MHLLLTLSFNNLLNFYSCDTINKTSENTLTESAANWMGFSGELKQVQLRQHRKQAIDIIIRELTSAEKEGKGTYENGERIKQSKGHK